METQLWSSHRHWLHVMVRLLRCFISNVLVILIINTCNYKHNSTRSCTTAAKILVQKNIVVFNPIFVFKGKKSIIQKYSEKNCNSHKKMLTEK